MKVSTRLAVGFGLVLVLLVLVTVIAVARLSRLNQDLETVANARTNELLQSTALLENVTKSAMQMRNVLLLDDLKQVQNEVAAIHSQSTANGEILATLASGIEAGPKLERLKAIVDARAVYAPMEDELLKIANSGDHATAKDLMLGRVLQAQLKYIAAIKVFFDQVVGDTRRAAQEANENYRNGRALIIAVALVAFLVGSLAAFVIARNISGRINQAATIAETIAAGDLTSEVAVRSTDEIGQLLRALSRMNANLADIVGSVRGTSESVASAADKVATTTRSLSERTEEQATSLEETAASVEEMSGAVKENTSNAKQADELASSASVNAEGGGKAVQLVVATMDEITASSKRIGDIVSIIDAIAFQTNILALNAAVEAARAGEQGRGFAVVASEVRSLAQRSANAAKEIKELVDASVGKVERGNQQVKDAGVSIDRLVGDVRRVSALMSDIANASVEQSRGIEQINAAVSRSDTLVQQNAALVGESAAAAVTVRTQAGELLDAVGKFRLREDHGPARVSHAAPSALVTTQAARISPHASVAKPAAPRTRGYGKSSASNPASADEEGWHEF